MDTGAKPLRLVSRAQCPPGLPGLPTGEMFWAVYVVLASEIRSMALVAAGMRLALASVWGGLSLVDKREGLWESRAGRLT